MRCIQTHTKPIAYTNLYRSLLATTRKDLSIQSSILNLKARHEDLLILSTVIILSLATLAPGSTQISDRERSWNAHCGEQLDSNEVPSEHANSEPGSPSTLKKRPLVSKRTLQALVRCKLQFNGKVYLQRQGAQL